MKKITQHLKCLLILLTFSSSGFGQALHWLTPPKSDPGAVLNGAIEEARISANGRYVSFLSTASNHISGDTNQFRDLFVYDRLLDQIQRASELGPTQNSGTVFARQFSKVSSDGQYVAFTGSVTVFNTTVSGLFLKSFSTGLLRRVNIDENGDDIALGFFTTFNDLFLDDSGSSIIITTTQSLDPRHSTSAENIYRLNLADQSVTLLSVSADNNMAAGSGVRFFSMSDSGRFLVFSTAADNLVANSSGNTNVYLRDTLNETTQLVTVQPNGDPSQYVASSQGRVAVSNAGEVVFNSKNNDLVVGDSGDSDDLFLFDGTQNTLIVPGSVERLLVNGGGEMVSFSTTVIHDSQDVNGVQDVFTYNNNTNQLNRITDMPPGSSQIRAQVKSISTNGQDILFTSNAQSLSSNGPSGQAIFRSIYHHDTTIAVTEPIRPTAYNPNTLLGGISSSLVSSDQRYAIITTRAPNVLTQLQTEVDSDVFLIDRETDQRRLIGRKATASDVSSSGQYVLLESQFIQPAGTIDLGAKTLMTYDRINDSYTLIGEGRGGKVNNEAVVVYSSTADSVPNDNNGESDVYLFNPSDSSLSLISKNLTGEAGNGRSGFPDIANSNAGDTWVTFNSTATDLINSDVNDREDVFMASWPNGNVIRASQTPAGAGGNGTSDLPAISADGNTVVFISFSSNFVNQVSSFASHVYAYDRVTQVLTLVTQDENQAPIEANPLSAQISDTGRYAVFNSLENSSVGNVFLADLQTNDITSVSQPLDGSGSISGFFSTQVVENTAVSPTLVGVNFIGSGQLTGVAEHPGTREAYFYQQGGPNVDLDIEVIGLGTVQGTQGINCMSACNSNYPLGTVLTLAASPEPGFVFDRWNSSRGQCVDDTNPCELTMNRAKNIQASFIDSTEIIFSNGFE